MRQALEVLQHGLHHISIDFKNHNEYEQFINDLLQNDNRQSTLHDFLLI